MNNHKRYTPEEQEAFIEVAREEGISRTMRQLGYPDSWNTANRWFTARSITPPIIDEVKQKAVQMREMYGEKEQMVVLQQGLERVLESLNSEHLTPDDQKKLAEAAQKYINTMHLVAGKSTQIVENRDNVIPEIMNAIREQEIKSKEITDLFA